MKHDCLKKEIKANERLMFKLRTYADVGTQKTWYLGFTPKPKPKNIKFKPKPKIPKNL